MAETVAAVHRCTVTKSASTAVVHCFSILAAQVALHREDIWAPISAAAVEKGKRNGAISILSGYKLLLLLPFLPIAILFSFFQLVTTSPHLTRLSRPCSSFDFVFWCRQHTCAQVFSSTSLLISSIFFSSSSSFPFLFRLITVCAAVVRWHYWYTPLGHFSPSSAAAASVWAITSVAFILFLALFLFLSLFLLTTLLTYIFWVEWLLVWPAADG